MACYLVLCHYHYIYDVPLKKQCIYLINFSITFLNEFSRKVGCNYRYHSSSASPLLFFNLFLSVASFCRLLVSTFPLSFLVSYRKFVYYFYSFSFCYLSLHQLLCLLFYSQVYSLILCFPVSCPSPGSQEETGKL